MMWAKPPSPLFLIHVKKRFIKNKNAENILHATNEIFLVFGFNQNFNIDGLLPKYTSYHHDDLAVHTKILEKSPRLSHDHQLLMRPVPHKFSDSYHSRNNYWQKNQLSRGVITLICTVSATVFRRDFVWKTWQFSVRLSSDTIFSFRKRGKFVYHFRSVFLLS